MGAPTGWFDDGSMRVIVLSLEFNTQTPPGSRSDDGWAAADSNLGGHGSRVRVDSPHGVVATVRDPDRGRTDCYARRISARFTGASAMTSRAESIRTSCPRPWSSDETAQTDQLSLTAIAEGAASGMC